MAFAAILGVGVAQAATVNTVNWGAAGGQTDYVSDEVSFAAFNADTLQSVSGQAYFSTNNGALYPVTMTLELRLDGIWTSIFTQLTTGTTYVNTAVSNVSFVYGMVSGIRVSASGQQPGFVPMGNWALGPGFSPTVFTFETLNPPAVVPLPAGLPLLMTGLAGIGLLRRRRRIAS